MSAAFQPGRILQALSRKTSRFLKRYRTRGGGVAVTFALALIPMSMLGLAAVDFHRASSVKMQLQDALDAATLAAARSTATTQAGIQTIGANVLKANLKSFTDVSLTSSSFVLGNDGTVTSTAYVDVKPLIANLFLGSDMPVKAEAIVKRANNKIELALVLDNTGSMASSNKLTNTKTAATGLINTLAAAAARTTETDAVRISLVPFSISVRLPTTYKTATWMDQNAASPINDLIFTQGNASTVNHANRWTLFNNMNISWAGCVESRKYPYDVQDTAPTTATPATLFTPFFAPDEPDVSDYSNDSTWKNYDTTNNYIDDGLSANSGNKNWWTRQGRTAKYVSSGLNTSNGKGPNMGCTMQPLSRLTTDYNSLKTSINAMVATGNTNVPMGLVWGWHTISPNTPFADGKAYGTDKLKKIIVLMTDGENTYGDANNPNESFYIGLGYIFQNRLGITSGTESQRRAKMDARMAELCTNIKAKNIELYVIGVMVDSYTSSLLSACATDSAHYFDVSQSSQLTDVFNTIAGSIANMHLSH
jgi:Flp pilus assembly protein TadG